MKQKLIKDFQSVGIDAYLSDDGEIEFNVQWKYFATETEVNAYVKQLVREIMAQREGVLNTIKKSGIPLPKPLLLRKTPTLWYVYTPPKPQKLMLILTTRKQQKETEGKKKKKKTKKPFRELIEEGNMERVYGYKKIGFDAFLDPDDNINFHVQSKQFNTDGDVNTFMQQTIEQFNIYNANLPKEKTSPRLPLPVLEKFKQDTFHIYSHPTSPLAAMKKRRLMMILKTTNFLY